MSKEYIEREAVIDIFKEGFKYEEPMMLEWANSRINSIPAADVAPVVHGEWIPIVSYFHGKPDGRYYCSECHRVETMKGIYCRLCGALMDGGKPNA